MAISRRSFITGLAGASALGVGGLTWLLDSQLSNNDTRAGEKARASGGGSGKAPGNAPSSATSIAPAGANAPTSPAGTGATPGILVLVTLYGGNDGLNTLVPYQDPAYASGRATLSVAPSDVLVLGDGLGLHPNLTGLKKLWDANQLAIVRGVGYPSPNRSHFRSMDIWQSGVPDRQEITGWLGRWLDAQARAAKGSIDPLLALAIDTSVPRALVGATRAAAAVSTASVSALALPGGTTIADAYRKLGGNWQASGSASAAAADGLASLVGRSSADLITVESELSTALGPAAAGAKTGTGGATGTLAAQLDVVARAIAGGAATRVYSVRLDGFDTHADEKARHAQLMSELGDALGGFVGKMAASPNGVNVTVVVYSEFGRRVAANASGGTDHGTAAPVFVAGPSVKGGKFYGDEPSLTDLDAGDLKFTTDFRSMYATVLERVLGSDPTEVLAGTFPQLAFV